MNKRILLGINSDGEIVFANINIDSRNKLNMEFIFTAPFNVEDDEFLHAKIDELIKSADPCWLYDWLVEYDCCPSELPDVIFNNWKLYDIVMCFDNSNEIFVNGNRYRLETLDSWYRMPEALEIYTSKSYFDMFADIYKKYSKLVIADAHIIEKIMCVINAYDAFDEEKLLKDYVSYLTI